VVVHFGHVHGALLFSVTSKPNTCVATGHVINVDKIRTAIGPRDQPVFNRLRHQHCA